MGHRGVHSGGGYEREERVQTQTDRGIMDEGSMVRVSDGVTEQDEREGRERPSERDGRETGCFFSCTPFLSKFGKILKKKAKVLQNYRQIFNTVPDACIHYHIAQSSFAHRLHRDVVQIIFLKKKIIITFTENVTLLLSNSIVFT